MFKEQKKSILSGIILTCLLILFQTNAANSHKGFDPSQMDLSVKPGADFYEYAVGTGVKNITIPEDQSSWGAFNVLEDKAYYDLHKILQTPSKEKVGNNTIKQKVLDFYLSGINVQAINSEGNKPLRPYFREIDEIKNVSDLAKETALLQLYNSSPIFGISVEPDAKNTKIGLLSLYQGGLGLPSKEYYLKDDENFIKIRKEYLKYIENMFALCGLHREVSKQNAKTVMRVETELAKISKSPEELRDPIANYNKKTVNELKELSPDFNWKVFFFSLREFKENSVNVGQPLFLSGLSKLIKTIPLSDWKVYLKWNVINSMAPYLEEKYVQENFNFYETVLSGVKTIKSRWKQVIDEENNLMGEALGQLYVKEYFSAEVKQKVMVIVKALIQSLEERITQLDWMTPETNRVGGS